ncbi:MAG: hypothetical protein NXI12_05640 [Alphaproteobacteria bacterium]|nr:hypothetical protein [Alphaproteobacteria bacterium]
MKRLLVLVSACALSLAACTGSAGNWVEWGGVMNPAEPPVQTSPCYQAGWTPLDRRSPRYPSELFAFLRLAQVDQDERRFILSYDISEQGTTANIRYVEPERYLEHAATRSAIRAAADAVADWRFTPGATSTYATGCITQFNFATG